MVPLAHLDHKDLQEKEDSMGHLARLELKVSLDLVVLMVVLVHLDQLVLLVFRVGLDQEDLMVDLDFRVQGVEMDHLDLQDDKETLDYQVLLDLAPLDLQVLLDPLEQEVVQQVLMSA